MRSKHEKKNALLDKAFYHSTHEYKRTHFRAWKRGKTWVYAGAVVVLFAGNFANFANPEFLSAFGTITAHAATLSGYWCSGTPTATSTPISFDNTTGILTIGTAGTTTTATGYLGAALTALGLTATSVTSINFVGPVNAPTGLTASGTFGTTSMFGGLTNLTSITGIVQYLNLTSGVNISYWFSNDTALQTLDLSNWNVSSVNAFNSLFQGDSGLTSLTLTNWSFPLAESSAFAYQTQSMFNGVSKLTTLDLSSWKFNSNSFYRYDSMFAGMSALQTLNLTGWSGKARDVSYMFNSDSNLTSLLGGINNTNGDTTPFDVSGSVNFRQMFQGTGLSKIDTTNWAWASGSAQPAASMNQMFSNSAKLAQVIVPNWNVQNVNDFTSMFQTTGLTSLDASQWVWGTGPTASMQLMFSNDTSLTTVNTTGWQTQNITSMNNLFAGDVSLGSITGISAWKVGNSTNFVGFLNMGIASSTGVLPSGNTAMTGTLDLSGWGLGATATSLDLRQMFSGMRGLTGINMSGWNTSKSTSFYGMFNSMTSLTGSSDTALPGLSSFNVTGATGDGSSGTNNNSSFGGMFGYTNLSTLNLSGWAPPAGWTANVNTGALGNAGFVSGDNLLSTITIGSGITALGASAGVRTLAANQAWQRVGTGTVTSPTGPLIGSSATLMASSALVPDTYVVVNTSQGTMNFAYGANVVNGASNPALSGFTLPATQTLSGAVGSAITYPSLPAAPAGFTWNIALSGGATGNYVDGTTSAYSQMQTALPLFPSTNFTANWTLNANTQTATFTYVYPNGTTATAAPSETGLTGATPATPATLNSLPNGYGVFSGNSIQGPNGQSYSTLAAALAANPYNASNNNFKINVSLNYGPAGQTIITYKGDTNFNYVPVNWSGAYLWPAQYQTGYNQTSAPVWNATTKQWTYSGTWSDAYSTINFTFTSTLNADGSWTYGNNWTYANGGGGSGSASQGTDIVIQPTSLNAKTTVTKPNTQIKINNQYTVPTATVGTDSLVSTSIGALTQSPTGSNATITSNADGTINFSATTAGVYTFPVTYTDQYGNTTTSNDTVTVAQTPVFNLSSVVITTANAANLITNPYGTATDQPLTYPYNTHQPSTDQSGNVIQYNNYSLNGNVGAPNMTGAYYGYLQAKPGVYKLDYQTGTIPTEDHGAGPALYWYTYTDAVTGDSMEMFAYSNATVYLDKTIQGTSTTLNSAAITVTPHSEVTVTVQQTPVGNTQPLTAIQNEFVSPNMTPDTTNHPAQVALPLTALQSGAGTDENGNSMSFYSKLINGTAQTGIFTQNPFNTNPQFWTSQFSDTSEVGVDFAPIGWGVAGAYTLPISYTYPDSLTADSQAYTGSATPPLPITVSEPATLNVVAPTATGKTLTNVNNSTTSIPFTNTLNLPTDSLGNTDLNATASNDPVGKGDLTTISADGSAGTLNEVYLNGDPVANPGITVTGDGKVVFPQGVYGDYKFVVTYTDIFGNVYSATDEVIASSTGVFTQPTLTAGATSIYIGQTFNPKAAPLWGGGANEYGSSFTTSDLNNPNVTAPSPLLVTYNTTGANGLPSTVDTSTMGTYHYSYQYLYTDPTKGGQYEADGVTPNAGFSATVVAGPATVTVSGLSVSVALGQTLIYNDASLPSNDYLMVNGDGTTALNAIATVSVYATPSLNPPKDVNGSDPVLGIGNITLIKNTKVSDIASVDTSNAPTDYPNSGPTTGYAALLWNGGKNIMGSDIMAYINSDNPQYLTSSPSSPITGNANTLYTGERFIPAGVDAMNISETDPLTPYEYTEADGTQTNSPTTGGVANTKNTPFGSLTIDTSNLVTTMGYDSVTHTNDIPIATGGSLQFVYQYIDPTTQQPVTLTSTADIKFITPNATGNTATGNVNVNIPLDNSYILPDLSEDSVQVPWGTGTVNGSTVTNGTSTVEDIINQTAPDAIAGASLSGFNLLAQDGTGSAQDYSLYKASADVYDIVASSTPGETNPPAPAAPADILGTVTLETDVVTGQPDGNLTVNTTLRGQYSFTMSFYDSYDNKNQVIDTLTIGALTLDDVPSFGFSHALPASVFSKSYTPDVITNEAGNTESTPNVVITDTRTTTPTGWTLTLSQSAFTDKNALNPDGTLANAALAAQQGHTLPNSYMAFTGLDPGTQGAQAWSIARSLQLTPGTAGVSGPSSIVFGAVDGKGEGANNMSMGNATLNVPSTDMQLSGVTYEATLTWTLADVPPTSAPQ